MRSLSGCWFLNAWTVRIIDLVTGLWRQGRGDVGDSVSRDGRTARTGFHSTHGRTVDCPRSCFQGFFPVQNNDDTVQGKNWKGPARRVVESSFRPLPGARGGGLGRRIRDVDIPDGTVTGGRIEEFVLACHAVKHLKY